MNPQASYIFNVQASGKKTLITFVVFWYQLLTIANAEPLQKLSFQVQVLGKSKSGRIYLFQTPEPPSTLLPGKVMLLQEIEELVMAFQILKIHEQKNMFLGKRIRRYARHRTLALGAWYQATQIQHGGKTLDPQTLESLDAWEFPSSQKIQFDDLDSPGPSSAPLAPLENHNAATNFLDDLDVPPPRRTLSLPPPLESLDEPILKKEIVSLASSPPLLPQAISLPQSKETSSARTTQQRVPASQTEEKNTQEPFPFDEKTEVKGYFHQPSPSSAKKEPFPFDASEKKQPSPLFDVEDQPLEESSEERSEFEPTSQSLSLGVSFVGNNASSNTITNISTISTNTNTTGSPTGGKQFFSAGVMRYGMRIKKKAYLHSLSMQDSITAEINLHLYKVLGYINQADAYVILGLMPTLRYNLFFSEHLGVFGYLGFLRNAVLSASEPSDAGLGSLNSFYIASGVGLFLELGPNWFARADLGLESMGLGLVLRF